MIVNVSLQEGLGYVTRFFGKNILKGNRPMSSYQISMEYRKERYKGD